MVNVNLRRFESGGKRVIRGQGRATATREDGRLVYKVNVRLPPGFPGRYDLQIISGLAGRDKALSFVVGEVDVE